MPLHLIVIGAGLAGLGAALSTKIANPDHQVTILESVRELAEIGVSILSFPLLLSCNPPHTQTYKPSTNETYLPLPRPAFN